MKLTGKNRSTRVKTCPSATLSTTNPTWSDPGSNPGLRGERPATNRLSRDTTKYIHPFAMHTPHWVCCFKLLNDVCLQQLHSASRLNNRILFIFKTSGFESLPREPCILTHVLRNFFPLRTSTGREHLCRPCYIRAFRQQMLSFLVFPVSWWKPKLKSCLRQRRRFFRNAYPKFWKTFLPKSSCS
jgi:hypothetical protein